MEKMLSLALLIALSLLCLADSEKIFKQDFLYISDAYYTLLKMTELEDLEIIVFDLTSQYNRIAQEVYTIPEVNSSVIVGNASLVLNDFITLNGIERKVLVQSGEGNESQLYMSIVNTFPHSQFCGRSNVMAMGYKPFSRSHSYTHLLQDKGQIEKAAFTFYMTPNQSNGTAYFGGIPSEITEGYLKTSAPVLGMGSNWDIPLSHVFIDNISYVYENVYQQVQHSAYLSSTQSFIEVPDAFFDTIVHEVFDVTLEQGQCVMKKFGIREIQCQCNIIAQFKPISFVIEGKAFRFNSEELFNKLDTICTYQIVSNVNDNNWVLGISFLKKYITTFDYDNHNVVFYSKEALEAVYLDTLFPAKRIIKWTLIIGSIVFMLGAIKVIQVIMRKKKINRYKKAIGDVYQSL